MFGLPLALGLAIVGALWVFAYWSWHDVGSLFGPRATWPRPPDRLRLLLRRGPGDVHLFSLLNEVWGLLVVALGLAMHTGIVSLPWETAFTFSALGLALPFAITGIVVISRAAS